ncbi:MAG TPA: GGDEF domain-containing protein [Kofleriaceae bacterium]|nr:GGDEF domain-containing protein [Kofleriaceae bacterium]
MSLLASFRERLSIGQLSDELADTRERSRLLADAAAALIACVKALALDIDELGSARLKASLDETLARVRAEAPPRELSEQLGLRQREALEFASKERRYLEERDTELRGIIGLLTDGLARLGEGNTSHDVTVLERSSRIESAAQLGDIVKIRQVISREVQGLRKAVADKQAADRARTAALTGEVKRLRSDISRALTAAATDPLTGAANRGAFDAELGRLCDLAAAGGDGFALLLLDVDHFKAINDTHGHPVGDRVLMALVAFCRESVRKGDLIARWGGEEFVVLLPSASLRVAASKARDLLKALARRRWNIDDGNATLAFTVSAGATAWRDGDAPADVVARADQALYKAKQAGRNRVVKAP